jgi:biotin-(acetyl-CoA carboxylase) ligase
VSREGLLRAILECLDAYLALDDAELARRVQARWEALLWRLWQDVRIDQGGTSVSGVVEGLAPSGALRVRTAVGVLELAVGDVS